MEVNEETIQEGQRVEASSSFNSVVCFSWTPRTYASISMVSHDFSMLISMSEELVYSLEGGG